MEAFFIVKSILRTVIDSSRITYRDSQSYFSVLVDDNNRKNICRLRFNRATKYIGLMDSEKNETKHVINSLDDLYSFSSQLIEVVGRFK
jgi:hypothetical protein